MGKWWKSSEKVARKWVESEREASGTTKVYHCGKSMQDGVEKVVGEKRENE